MDIVFTATTRKYFFFVFFIHFTKKKEANIIETTATAAL